MTIAATLDLEKAIETFKHTVSLLMQLGEVSEWDGQRLKEREQAIRQAALELAGQCIALLLHQLSQNALSQQQARQRTQTSRGFDHHSQGKKQVTMTTVGNVILFPGNLMVGLRNAFE